MPILAYPSQGIEYVEYTYGQLDRFTSTAAQCYATLVRPRQSSAEREMVVAILGLSNLDYFITTLALSRLGFTVLFLSTRISEAAYVSLLRTTKCHAIVVDSRFKKTTVTIKAQVHSLEIVDILNSSHYACDTRTVSNQDRRLNPSQEHRKIAWIIHSSGSTGMPKPIYQTHQAALRNYENNMNMEGFITLPLFHAHGLSSVFRAITSNKKIFMNNASLPMTSQNLLTVLQKHKFEIFYGVPYALKLLSETIAGIQALAAMQVVMFGGSACPDSLGDLLVDGGVHLISHYGTTETGQLMTSFRPQGDKAWNYVRVHDNLVPFVKFEQQGNGELYELVVLEGWPSKVASNRSDGSYATKDLFEKHPTIAHAWKYGGRLDDTIVLMNGEKAIPISVEQAVRQNRHVKDAVVFGSGQSRLGMAVIAAGPSSECEILDCLQPIIEEENKVSPAYAQLSLDMVIVLPAGTRYPQTDKGTLIRQAFYKDFSRQIENIYKRLEAASGGTLVLNTSELRSFIRNKLTDIVLGIRQSDIADDADLFALGVDSLQSTRLRSSILQKIQLNGGTLPQNVVFDFPTIAKLASAIEVIRDGGNTIKEDVKQEMRQLIEKHSHFPSHYPTARCSARRCIVVTGATGSLGAHIIAQLCRRDDVDEVCCLVRASSDHLAKVRVVSSMRERAVFHDLHVSQRHKITALASSTTDADLGLSDQTYGRLAQDIISVIHCAWSVNFNKALSSFEDCISGARNLMLLCLKAKQPTPASFNFCSSVSSVANSAGLTVPEAFPESLDYAQDMGYAQSKLITENIIARAAEQRDMLARVLRVGQIVADTQQGIWNHTEAIPLMLQAATTFGALPALDESPRWLPCDAVATSIIDVSLSTSSETFFNIVNPQTFHWTHDLLPMLRNAGLTFREVGQREWIKLLRESDQDVEKNPTYKLLDFFASKYDNDTITRGSLLYETTHSESLSPALAAHPHLTQSLVTKFVSHFQATSWAETTIPQKTRLIVLAGPAGAGKTTIANELSSRIHCTAIEGDSVHDQYAVIKMATGNPLADLDRQIWLGRLRVQILEQVRIARLLDAKSSAGKMQNIIVTCSALKKEYRDCLRDLSPDRSVETVFVLLTASEKELEKRVGGREGHYFKSHMVKGQLAALQLPETSEKDVFPVDVEGGTTQELCEWLVEVLKL